MFRTISEFDKFKYFNKLEVPIRINNDFEVVGFFGYSLASVRSDLKMPRGAFAELEAKLRTERILDNKIVIICRDLVDFGTDDFAIQFHDSGCRVGKLSDVCGYGGGELERATRKVTHRLIDSVWTIEFYVERGKAVIVSYSKQDIAGYKNETTYMQGTIIEDENRNAIKLVLRPYEMSGWANEENATEAYEVANPKHIFDYK